MMLELKLDEIFDSCNSFWLKAFNAGGITSTLVTFNFTHNKYDPME